MAWIAVGHVDRHRRAAVGERVRYRVRVAILRGGISATAFIAQIRVDSHDVGGAYEDHVRIRLLSACEYCKCKA